MAARRWADPLISWRDDRAASRSAAQPAIPIATFRVDPQGLATPDARFGPHNIHENRPGSLQREDRIYLTYFAGGLRVIDISDPMRPREIAWYVPEVSAGLPQSNDVYVDADGLIYLVDRFEGRLDILEHADRGGRRTRALEPPRSLEDVGRELGIPRGRLRKAEAKARRKLRAASRPKRRTKPSRRRVK